MPAVPANIRTSLKLPSALKRQLEEDAEQMGMSLHAFMVSTLADAAQRKRLRQTLTQDSADALAVMKASGTGHALEDVRVYFSQMKEHRLGRSAPPAPLQPKKNGLRCEHRISKPCRISGFGAPGNVFVRVRRSMG